METIELTLEEVKERLRAGYIFTGLDSYNDRNLFFMSGDTLFRKDFEIDTLGNSCVYQIIKSCYDRGKLYMLDDPTMEER